jgi:dihydrofolate reductase
MEGLVGRKSSYHAPTFVLTHYEREPLVMEGGTTFYFVTGGIEEALRLAEQAAGDKTSRQVCRR